MKALLTVILFTLISLPSLAQTVVGSDPAMDRPNAVSLEILGRGGWYSLDYDRSLTDSVGIGVGLSAYTLTSDGGSASAFILPVYGNFYFSPGPHRGFVTAGLDVVVLSASVSGSTFAGSGAAPIIGGGYEYRGDGGFLFRAAPYLIIGSGETAFTIGLTFGYSFD